MGAKETCRLLDIHPVTLRRWAKEGKIDFIKVDSGHHRYAVTAFLEGHGATKPPHKEKASA